MCIYCLLGLRLNCTSTSQTYQSEPPPKSNRVAPREANQITEVARATPDLPRHAPVSDLHGQRNMTEEDILAQRKVAK